jgi:hypothetical protein
MFKAIILVLLVFFSSFVFADIQLIKPVQATLSHGDSLDLGEISRGETLELLISTESGKPGIEWDSVHAVRDLLPTEWKQEKAEVFGQTILLKVLVPKKAPIGMQRIKVRAYDSSFPEGGEDFYVNVFVKPNLVTVNFDSLKKESIVNQEVVFNVTLFNESIADHSVMISSSLPFYWFKPLTVKIPAKEIKNVELKVNPLVYGLKEFQFVFTSKENGSEIGRFNAELNVSPTLESKYSGSLYGFPFYSISLLPYYLVNSFLSLLIQ